MVVARKSVTRRRETSAPGLARARLARAAEGPQLRAPILEALARHVAVGLYLTDALGRAHYVNREACRIIGQGRAAVLGSSWTDTVHADDRTRVLRGRERAIARGAVFRASLRFVHRDARVVRADVVTVPIRERGRVVGRVGMMVEVAERAPLSAATPNTRAGRRWDDLSPQERRVLQRVVQGKTNKAIATELGLSHKTVKNYLSTAFQKLHVERRSQAAAIFARRSSDR